MAKINKVKREAKKISFMLAFRICIHNASNSGEKTRQGFYVHCLPWLWPQHLQLKDAALPLR